MPGPGSKIGHYDLLERLGAGGMGVVYKARDTGLDRIVALKFLPSHLSADSEQRSRFIREAKAASAIDHPNIGSVYEIGETDDGQSYIAMAFYEGETLRTILERGPIAPALAVDYACQIAKGMAKAHECGIIHRDLKPANVIITPDGVAKIIDFGLAKVSGADALTRSGASLGTVAYMSPEQARGEEIGAASDIWSLGVMMYEMLAGRPPFGGEFEAAILYSVVNENPPALTSLKPDLPMELVLIVEKALEKDPLRRYARMDELVIALTDLRKKSGESALPESGFDLITGYLRSLYRRNRRTVVVVSAAAGLLVIGLIAYRILFPPFPAKMNRSIVVMPFGNLSDSSYNYIPAEFKEDLSGAIARLPGVVVISSKSASASGMIGKSDSSTASEFGVRFILRGDLSVSVASLRLSAKMYDAELGSVIWTETFEAPRAELLMIRSRIVEKIAGSLRTNYQSEKVFTHLPQADVYDAFLQGGYFSEKRTRDSYKMARAYFLDAIGRDSSYTPPYLALASIDIEEYGIQNSEKILDEAESFCQKAISRDSLNSQAYALEGMILDARGNRDSAIATFMKSLSLDPNDVSALTGLGSMYLFELNEPAKSIVYLKRAQELNPTYWIFYANLGVGYAQTKNYSDAKSAFLHAISLDPTQGQSISGLGYTYERLGMFDSAAYYYRTGILQDPKSVPLYTNIVSVLLIQQKTSEAESLLTSAVKLAPGEQELYYILGLVLRMAGKRAASEQYFSDGLKICRMRLQQESGSPDLTAFEGLFNARLGRNEEAVSAARRACALDSMDEEISMKCARIFAIMGNKAQMLSFFRHARSMNPEYDPAYLATAIDFENYRHDPDLLTLARQDK